MFNLIENYLSKISKDDIRNFALSKDINLSDNELDFTYDFFKKNYHNVLKNPQLFDLNRYKDNYTKENFSKITKVYQEYYQKYSNYL